MAPHLVAEEMFTLAVIIERLSAGWK